MTGNHNREERVENAVKREFIPCSRRIYFTLSLSPDTSSLFLRKKEGKGLGCVRTRLVLGVYGRARGAQGVIPQRKGKQNRFLYRVFL